MENNIQDKNWYGLCTLVLLAIGTIAGCITVYQNRQKQKTKISHTSSETETGDKKQKPSHVVNINNGGLFSIGVLLLIALFIKNDLLMYVGNTRYFSSQLGATIKDDGNPTKRTQVETQNEEKESSNNPSGKKEIEATIPPKRGKMPSQKSSDKTGLKENVSSLQGEVLSENSSDNVQTTRDKESFSNIPQTKNKSSQPTIWIFPFRNMTGPEGKDRYSDESRRQLKNVLSAVSNFNTAEYKPSSFGDSSDPLSVGKKLGADVIVTGAVSIDESNAPFDGYGIHTNTRLVTATIEIQVVDVKSGRRLTRTIEGMSKTQEGSMDFLKRHSIAIRDAFDSWTERNDFVSFFQRI
jgi:TolB-like protein